MLLRKLIGCCTSLILRLINGFGLYSLLHRLAPKGVTIVGYHRLSEELPDGEVHVLAVKGSYFEQHVAFYRRHYELVTMDEAVALLQGGRRLDKHYLVLTFDDGYRDNHALGLPLFRKHGLRPTIYLTAGAIESRVPLWTDLLESMLSHSGRRRLVLRLPGFEEAVDLADASGRKRLAERLKDLVKQQDEAGKAAALRQLREQLRPTAEEGDALLLRWEEARELAEAGAELGSHTLHHPTLSRIPLADAERELAESRRLLARRLGLPVAHFAYPYGRDGDYTDAVKAAASRLYRSAVTAENGVNYPGEDLYALRRVIVENIPVRRLQLRLLKQALLGRRRRRQGTMASAGNACRDGTSLTAGSPGLAGGGPASSLQPAYPATGKPPPASCSLSTQFTTEEPSP